MKNSFFILAFFLVLCLKAQQTISGTFSSDGKNTTIIAYLLKPGAKSYIADTTIQKREFALNIPASAEEGVYRLVYGLPEDELYFDIIYTGKETIELSFDTETGLTFKASEENKIFSSYFKEINSLNQEIISFYSENKTNKKDYVVLCQKLRDLQQFYEEKSEGLLVHEFIMSNKTYYDYRIRYIRFRNLYI